MGAYPIVERHHGRGLRNGRPGTANVLLGKHSVLVVPRDNAHVVRCRQLFREKHETVVCGNRDSDVISVVGESDSPAGGRVASE